jgi:hypothetical protein
LDGQLGHYRGGVTIPEADYVDVGELLATQLGRDYTFLHPEVLDERCSVEGDTLRLNNRVNHETYQVVIIPGHKTIYWSNLKKAKAFYDRGGKVIATGTLPSKSAEFGHDEDVVKTIDALFPGARAHVVVSDEGKRNPAVSKNLQGGMAVFLEKPTAQSLQDALDRMLEVYDVEFEAGKALRYIHKICDGRHIYFLANLNERPISTRVGLRGTLRPELWNPHTGEISQLKFMHEKQGAVEVTHVRISLLPTTSMFISGQEEE